MNFIKSTAKAVLVTFLVLFIIAFLIGLAMPTGDEVNDMMDDTYSTVAKDYVAQYQMAKASGTYADRCVRAGLVAEAYMQANDFHNYSQWLAVRGADCAEAGVIY